MNQNILLLPLKMLYAQICCNKIFTQAVCVEQHMVPSSSDQQLASTTHTQQHQAPESDRHFCQTFNLPASEAPKKG